MSPHHKLSSKGFTLLEILVALFIFTIISVVMASALHNLFNTQSGTDKRAARLTELQIALLFISRDVEQTINRPITNHDGVQEAAFVGKPHSITLTHAGLANPQGLLLRSTLQRTEYALENSIFIRRTWPVLDQTNKTTSDQRVLLKSVSTCWFEYLDQDNHFQKAWPPVDKPKASALPRAVRISLSLPKWGKISETLIIPGQTIEALNKVSNEKTKR